MTFKTILHTLALGIACTLSLSALAAQQPEQEKPVILWDLHDVVLKKTWANYRQMLGIAYNCTKKTEMLWSKNSFAMVKNMLSLASRAAVLAIQRKSGPTGEEFMAVAREHNNDALADFILECASCQTVEPIAAKIIKEFHKRGYTQRIASNMGEKSARLLFAKQEPEFQEIFNPEIFDLNKSQVVDYSQKPPLKKPEKGFFTACLEKNNLEAQDAHFFDDSRKNCKQAEGLGMRVTRVKTQEQMAADVKQQYGIDVTTD